MKKLTLFILILVTSLALNAQVAINTSGNMPDNSAMIDVQSTDRGMLVPRMLSEQRAAISSPANGLLVYDLNTESFWFYQNGSWTELRAGNITNLSDADSDTKVEVEASPDEDIIRFYSKNVNSFSIDSMRIEPLRNSLFIGKGAGGLFTDRENVALGDYALSNNGTNATELFHSTMNTAVGTKALFSNTNGWGNTACGTNTLYKNSTGFDNAAYGYGALEENISGNHNIAVGGNALSNNTFGSENTAIGLAALFSNISGWRNTACGNGSLDANTIGFLNTAVGSFSLYSNTSGNANVAVGNAALHFSTTSSNLVAIGDSALYHCTGPNNSAVGSKALFSITTGEWNTAIGFNAIYSDTAGTENTANGYQALYKATGSRNTAIGSEALINLTSGNENTAIGSLVYPTGDTIYSNYTGIGYYTGTDVANPSNRVEIGNSSVGWIGGQVDWSTYSDKRIKENIQSDVPGLAFITRLRPVTYNLNIHKQNRMNDRKGVKEPTEWQGKYDIENKRMTGFLAQEVAEAAREAGFEFSGVDIPENEDELYSLRYAQFVVPLVKAVQELQQQIENLKTENTTVKKRLLLLEKITEEE